MQRTYVAGASIISTLSDLRLLDSISDMAEGGSGCRRKKFARLSLPFELSLASANLIPLSSTSGDSLTSRITAPSKWLARSLSSHQLHFQISTARSFFQDYSKHDLFVDCCLGYTTLFNKGCPDSDRIGCTHVS
jgi:hypothetical protein